MQSKVRFGMVGGGPDAFIGKVHQTALQFDNQAVLAAGCFSSSWEKNLAAGEFYGLPGERVYASYQAMAEAEAGREDGIDFVAIVTPNSLHYPAAKAFLEQGVSVMCEKPLCLSAQQARELCRLTREKGLLFGVMYSYSGYPMVKQARELVRQGAIGDVVNVNAEFLQEWLIDDIGSGDDSMVKLSAWRKNPQIAGGSNCVGDLCTHVEHTVSYITGLGLRRVAAKLDTFGQPLDLNANILVELENGAHGVFCSSQVCAGHMNGLVVRIFGTKGAVEWVQEEPEVLRFTPKGEPTRIYHRGMGYIDPAPAANSRLPSGHPEGLYAGFANVYRSFVDTLLRHRAGGAAADADFPTVEDGLRGVRFVEACLASSQKDAQWVSI